MTHEPPLACSLSPAGYRRRIADARELADQHLRSRDAVPGGARLTFADGADTRRRLEALVAAEASCCPFLTLDLHWQNGVLVLDVTGPADAAPIIAELFE